MATLMCKLVMSKSDGVTLTVVDDEAGITQTIKLDGVAITTEVSDGTDTSTITRWSEAK